MPGRPRRVRLLAIAVCLFFVYVLYWKKGAERVAGYIPPSKVGGGSVLRPTAQNKEGDAASGPHLEDTVEPRPAYKPQAADTEPIKHGAAATAAKAAGPAPTPSASTPDPEPEAEPGRWRATNLAPTVPTAASSVDDGTVPVGQGDRHAPPASGEFEPDEIYPSPTDVYNPPEVIHWKKQPERWPVPSTIPLPSGTPKSIPLIQKEGNKGADVQRLAAVKAACKHAWEGYRGHGWGYDEVEPVTGTGKDSFNGWGATLVDSLDTLWIMGMQKEFEDAVNQTKNIDFTTSSRGDIPMFEVTIRYLGGLIGAYDVSGQKYRLLLDKAVELAEILYSAFDTPNRMPETYYDWQPIYASNSRRASTSVVMAELGTLSLEFTRLAQLTKEPKYYDAIARITDAFQAWQNKTRLPGMWPTLLDASGCAQPVHVPHTPTQKQIPVPGGHSYMTSGRPAKAGADVMNQAEAAMNQQPYNPLGAHARAQAQNQAQLQPQAGSPHAPPAAAPRSAAPATELRWTDGTPVTRHKRHVDVADVVDANANPAPGTAAANGASASQPNINRESGYATAGTPDDAPEFEPPKEPKCIPRGLQSTSPHSTETFTLGGQSDSTYEYLPKMHLLLGGRVDQYKDMYLASMIPWAKQGLFRPMTPEGLDILISGEVVSAWNYTSEEYYQTTHSKAEHLTCFAGGMFALGGKLFDLPEHVELGRKLTEGCVWAYNATTTGIMPEGFTALACDDHRRCDWNQTRYWEELDPYRSYRDEQRQEYADTYGAEALRENSKPTTVAPSASTHGGRPSSQRARQGRARADHDRGTSAARERSLDKRQLHEENVADNKLPPLPHAAPSPTPVRAPADQANHGAGAGSEDVTVPPPSTHPSDDAPAPPSPVDAILPAYTPPPPPTHQQYVAQKIEDERLPPGFVRINSRTYILRPEAIESVFYMYRVTGDPHWRDVGWKMFTAVEKHTHAAYGHSAIDDVTKAHPDLLDGMESFWIAETLKYFYLLFDEPSRWSLDEWVLNTEAHFFQRPGPNDV